MVSALEAEERKNFAVWLRQMLRPRVLARQIRPEVFDSAMAGVDVAADVLERQDNQKEFALPIWDYLEIAASDERARNGRQMFRRHRALFNRIEQSFGVEPEVVTAIWGLESGYGVIRGSHPVLTALATLAWRGRRAAFFEDELVAVLRLIQSGRLPTHCLVGSWAGAIGHGQFMPSSLVDFAVDFDGDGAIDVCGDDPTDALASVANYLAKHGWKMGQPWGFPIALPEGFDYALSGLDIARPTREWAALGVTARGGAPVPDYGPGSVFLPAGAGGAAFLVLRNFHVILRYNRAEAYALGIGLLADRIVGTKPVEGPWPRDDETLTGNEIGELQFLLTEAGFDTLGVDGLKGPDTTRALRAWQQAQGLVPDGYLCATVLERLRGGGAKS